MYIKILGENTQKFPYTLQDLRTENPNVSFPVIIAPQILELFDVYPVVEQGKPATDRFTYAVKQNMPVLVNGQWTILWDVVDKTDEAIAEETEHYSTEIRESRNGMLSKCDWTQMPDAPLSDQQKQQWLMYRQELRDLPTQSGFPWNITWPIKPE